MLWTIKKDTDVDGVVYVYEVIVVDDGGDVVDDGGDVNQIEVVGRCNETDEFILNNVNKN